MGATETHKRIKFSRYTVFLLIFIFSRRFARRIESFLLNTRPVSRDSFTPQPPCMLSFFAAFFHMTTAIADRTAIQAACIPAI